MTEEEKIKALVTYRMKQAEDALQAAKTLIDADLLRDALSRAYYAIFYGVLALLATRKLGTSKHSGALTLLSREFIKTGLLPPEMSKLARRAFEQRLEADYAEMVEFSTDEVEEMLDNARLFIDKIQEILPELI